LGADFDLSKAVSQGLTLAAGTNINALIDKLAKTVDAKILNSPNLWTKDNEEAIFFKGREISLEAGSQDSNNGVTKTYKPEKIGVTLKVRPNITPAKDVDITIELEISDLAAELVNTQPVINRMVTSTNLIIKNGETIMLGGILFQSESETNSKVPLLGEIPIVGALFSHEDKSLRNSELLIFLTPHVVTDKKNDISKKFTIGPGNQGQSLMETKYISNPAERLQDIRKSLNESILKGLMNKN
jgi:general secretion pathway protein D